MAQKLNPMIFLDKFVRKKDHSKEVIDDEQHNVLNESTRSENSISSNDVKKGQEIEELNKVLTNFNMIKLKQMLKKGAPILHKNEDGECPMSIAAFYTRGDIMRIILKRYKDESSSDMEREFKTQASNALYTVCLVNSGEMAEMLLEAGAEVDCDLHLHLAAENGSKDVLEEIFKRMPDVEENINTLNIDGHTPLHCAIMRKHIHTVQYLLNKKANVNTTTYEGLNSVHLACQYAEEDILYLLVTRGGDVNAIDDTGKTPTMVAAQNGKDCCISVLAAAGANLDKRANNGHVPLIIAASNGHTNTVKEMILNGASFDVTDNSRYNALERAIISKKDGTAAMIIRLAPEEDYLEHYLDSVEIGLMKIVRYRLIETLEALLDRMLVQVDPSNPHLGVVRTKYLDVDTEKKTPADHDYQKNKTFFLQRLADLGDEEIAYNGTVRLLVDRKMRKFGNWILLTKIFSNIIFLLALAYSLIQASYENAPRDVYIRSGENIFRILTELYVFFHFAFNFMAEGVEFFRVTRLTYRYESDKKKDRMKERERAITFEKEMKYATINTYQKKERERTLLSKLHSIIWIRIITNYFSDKSNYLDIMGLSTLFILIILRIAVQPTQWVFATITFFVNSLRLFKVIGLIPYIGPYANIFYKILKRDVLQFLALFTIFLFIFTGTYFIALRTPYTSEGFRNVSLMQNTERVPGVDDSVQWVFLSGVRMLVEGNLYEDQYVYQHLNWLAAIVYITFLFLTVVVFFNVFIAQLSETYASVKENAERAYAWLRLNFIVQVQRTSLLSLCIDFRKQFFIDEIEIEKDEMFEYFGVYSVKNLNIKHFTEDVEVKGMLASIQNQQMLARKIHEISKSPVNNLHQIQPQDKGAEGIKELNAKMESLTESMGKLVREMNELKNSFSIETLMKMIEEKNK